MKKKKLSPKFPCECGHPKKLHGWAGVSIGGEWCDARHCDRDNCHIRCRCAVFIPDNLKYLEQLSKKKGKGKIK